jgi:hypothetical protein
LINALNQEDKYSCLDYRVIHMVTENKEAIARSLENIIRTYDPSDNKINIKIQFVVEEL